MVRQPIAVLCTYDDQLPGKLLAKIASDQGGADLGVDKEARAWFEQRISLEALWFSNTLLVYKTLVLAFYFRQNRSRQAPELCGFTPRPPGLAPQSTEPERDTAGAPRWNNAEDVSHWEASIKWRAGKCSFCAGRGLRGANIQDSLRQCERGGKATVSGELGEAMHEEGFLPSNGCSTCHLSYDFCSAWMRNVRGKWELSDAFRSPCQYDLRSHRVFARANTRIFARAASPNLAHPAAQQILFLSSK